MIGEDVDLDLLSLFPQKDARIIGGMERKQAFFKVNNGGERAMPISCWEMVTYLFEKKRMTYIIVP